MTRVLEYLEIDTTGSYRCLKCDHVLGSSDVDYKSLTAQLDAPLGLGQPTWLSPRDSRYVLRHHCCPQCGVAFEVDMMPAEETALSSFRLDSGK